MNKYVLPVPSFLRGHLINKNRLYAYPTIPEAATENEFIILDSGAFGLSQKGQKMDFDYMKKLSAHYQKHNASDVFPYIGIAPDEFMNPLQTMANFKLWNENELGKVAPVLQFKKTKQLDIWTITEQCKFYSKYNPQFVAISNPGMTAIQAQNIMPQIIKIVRKMIAPKWIHNLGAGWNAADASEWIKQGFDSIDSIAYYTDAQNKKSWRFNSHETFLNESDSIVNIALQNQAIAQQNINYAKH
jgi:hypothetical protein